MEMAEQTLREKVNAFFYKHLRNTFIYRYLRGISDYMNFILDIAVSFKEIRLSQMDAFLRVVINQIRFTGTNAMFILGIISLSIGATTIIQAITFLPKFGQNDFIGNLLKMVIVREIGPLITAIIILTRSGSAIASELATQKLHREIEAIELMGINPLVLIVIPRLLGGIIAVSILIVYFDFIAFIGGFVIARLVLENPIPFSVFIDGIIHAMGVADILSTMLKSLVYGFVIPVTCAYYGWKANALFEIPIYTSKAVIRSLFAVFILNGITSAVFYL